MKGRLRLKSNPTLATVSLENPRQYSIVREGVGSRTTLRQNLCPRARKRSACIRRQVQPLPYRCACRGYKQRGPVRRCLVVATQSTRQRDRRRVVRSSPDLERESSPCGEVLLKHVRCRRLERILFMSGRRARRSVWQAFTSMEASNDCEVHTPKRQILSPVR